MLKRKIPPQQKTSTNRIIGLLRTTLDFHREDFKPTLGASTRTITLPQTNFTQSSAIEHEVNRNKAILYANTIPPR